MKRLRLPNVTGDESVDHYNALKLALKEEATVEYSSINEAYYSITFKQARGVIFNELYNKIKDLQNQNATLKHQVIETEEKFILLIERMKLFSEFDPWILRELYPDLS